MKKTTKKLLAVLVAMVMMVGCVSVAAFAQWGRGPQNELKADTMVVLGDSIPSGYGMHGDAGNAYTLGNQFTFGHGGYVEGTYPQLVADTLGVQNRYNYSRDAFRSVEIRRLIDPEYEAWLEQTENAQDHFISDAIMLIANVGLDERAAMAAEMQQTIRNADIIVLNFGNNDGGTYGFLAPFLPRDRHRCPSGSAADDHHHGPVRQGHGRLCGLHDRNGSRQTALLREL